MVLSFIGRSIALASVNAAVTGALAFADTLWIKALGIAVAVFIAIFVMQILFIPATIIRSCYELWPEVR